MRVPYVYIALLSVGLAALVCAVELGRRLGARQRRVDPGASDAAVGPMDGVVFGLLGLFLAFTFFGAASRFDHRRDLVVNEANAIQAAYLRLELLPAEPRSELQAMFRRYVEERVASYAKLPDQEAFQAEYDRSVALQREIWRTALAAGQRVNPPLSG